MFIEIKGYMEWGLGPEEFNEESFEMDDFMEDEDEIDKLVREAIHPKKEKEKNSATSSLEENEDLYENITINLESIMFIKQSRDDGKHAIILLKEGIAIHAAEDYEAINKKIAKNLLLRFN